MKIFLHPCEINKPARTQKEADVVRQQSGTKKQPGRDRADEKVSDGRQIVYQRMYFDFDCVSP